MYLNLDKTIILNCVLIMKIIRSLLTQELTDINLGIQSSKQLKIWGRK